MNNTIKNARYSLCCVFVILTTGNVMAQPTVASVQLGQHGEMVIKGSGLGSGPTIALYDNFDDAEIVGGELKLTPQVGQWHEISSSSPLFHQDNGGDLSLYVRGPAYAKLFFGVEDPKAIHGLKTFQEVYFSYSIRDIGDFPGDNGTLDSFSTISSTKDAWMMFGGRGDNTAYAVSKGEPAGNDLFIPAWTGNGFVIAGNNTSMNPNFWQHTLTENWDFGGWNTNMFHAELNPEEPYGAAEGFFSFINKNRYDVNVRKGNFMEDLREEGVPYPVWDRIKFFAWLRTGDADVQRLVDEVYVAIGPNANARVLVSDAETLETSTKAYHLIINQWNNSEIKASIPDHILKDSSDYFITVIDSNNERTTSIPLCPNCPSPPPLQLNE